MIPRQPQCPPLSPQVFYLWVYHRFCITHNKVHCAEHLSHCTTATASNKHIDTRIRSTNSRPYYTPHSPPASWRSILWRLHTCQTWAKPHDGSFLIYTHLPHLLPTCICPTPHDCCGSDSLRDFLATSWSMPETRTRNWSLLTVFRKVRMVFRNLFSVFFRAQRTSHVSEKYQGWNLKNGQNQWASRKLNRPEDFNAWAALWS